MKKYHLYLWIIALVGLMTSCSQDETDALQTATESNRVTLTASLPEDFAQIGTRALPTPPTNYKLRCVLEVWDMEETPALKVRKEVCPAAGDTQIDFTFELATTGQHIAMLWADYIPYDQTARPQEIAGLTGVESFGDKHYITTNGLKAVETNSTYIPQNPEAWNAFFASIQFTKKEKALTLPTTALNRPLMKLTIAEKNAERFTSCNRVTAKFNCPSKFNVATGTVIETKSVGITATDGWLNNGTDITIGGQTCKTLICLYMFADPADGTMGDITLEFTASEEGKSLSPVTIPAGIPRKRNYCINAAGNLIGESLSPTVDISVEINSGWKPDEEYDNDKAKVGDYYYSDGTWSPENKETNANPILGVVYEVNADGTGKLVSPTESNEAWTTTGNCVATGAGVTSLTSGKENTDMIFTKVSEGTYTLSDYPIFNACQELRTRTGNNGWYIPSTKEYAHLFRVVSTINNKITAISGGTEVVIPTKELNASTYWSSCEENQFTAFRMTSATEAYDTSKEDKHKVRFMLDF